MLTLPRVLVWVGATALVIFVFVIYSSVRILKTTVQGHTAALAKPVLETAIFPGVPAAFAESWNTATHGTALTSQDYLWLTLHIANIGQSHVRGISADLMLLPALQQEPARHREYHGVRRTARHNRAEHVTLLC
jgi:hypothetical protein